MSERSRVAYTNWAAVVTRYAGACGFPTSSPGYDHHTPSEFSALAEYQFKELGPTKATARVYVDSML